ncbi:hypothetical protein MTR_6g057595 [Medicago truncatula]|uniref:Uncharacterized protein n=1 Tax=Medicago truncatula TaxID=3880 RepID=A0A072UBL7_MEDTR|nr:hypothetical protein MTR_6g057595 [Medicago truncatula]
MGRRQLNNFNNSCMTIHRQLNNSWMTIHQQLNNSCNTTTQTDATGKLTQLSTTFMFTPKANSKRKRVKKTQKHGTGHAFRDLLAPASKSTRHGELCQIALRKTPFFTPKSQF